MAKWKITIIAILLMLPQILGLVQIQYSTDNLTWYNITSLDANAKEGYQIALTQNTAYSIRGKNDNGTYVDEWIYTSQKTKRGLPPMVGDGIIWFLIILNGLLFISPFFIRFNEKESINNIIKKGMWVVSLALLAYVTTIITTMADTQGLGITKDLLAIQWIFVKGIYIGMLLLVANIMLSTPKIWKEERMRKRMGED